MTGVSLLSYGKTQAVLLPVPEVTQIFLKTFNGIEKWHTIGIYYRNIVPELLWIRENGLPYNITFIDCAKAKDISGRSKW